MNTYQVALSRTYLVAIKAQSDEHAKRYAEYYLGDCPDLSSENEQAENFFVIQKIEMVYNESNETIEITD